MVRSAVKRCGSSSSSSLGFFLVRGLNIINIATITIAGKVVRITYVLRWLQATERYYHGLVQPIKGGVPEGAVH